jgi:hypothetical protein
MGTGLLNMPLKVTIGYSRSELEQDFYLSYGGSVEYEGDYDYEYSQAMAEFTNSELDNPTLFLKLFLNEGVVGFNREPFAKRAFSKSIYEQGLAAFLDGEEIPEAEELEILTNVLSWAIRSDSYDYKDMTLCQRIYQVMGPLASAEIDFEVGENIGDGSDESRVEIKQTLRINHVGEYLDIVTWIATAKKTITNPLTFEYEFEVETDLDVSEDIENLCRCLGAHPPDDDFNQEIIPDPFSPFTDSSGQFVLLYTETKDPVSPSNALAIYSFRYRDDAIQTVDVSTTIMWKQAENKKYKITLSEIVSPDVKAELDIRHKQIPMFEARLSRGLQHDMLRPLCTWIYQHVNPGPKGWQWVKIDHENDDEVITDNQEVFS